jgi:hypothetical protein
MDPQQSPGFMEAIADRLRRFTGLTGTADPSAAGAMRKVAQEIPGYREYAIRAQEQGQQPLPPDQWVQMMRQGGM